jgi:hypothetical protein
MPEIAAATLRCIGTHIGWVDLAVRANDGNQH